jgi:hypothetical protein
LAEMDALRGPGDIAFMKQGLERDQEVQIDVSELDFSHALGAYLPFQQCMVRLHPQNTPIGKGEMPMQDKPVALVTSANQGIGLQIAKDLAAHGFDCVGWVS